MSTALPSIIYDLDGTDSFVWVSSVYTLACTAVLPMSGRLADIFGRQRVLLAAILLFAAGSAVTGAATSMSMLIAGRSACLAKPAIPVSVSDHMFLCRQRYRVSARGLFRSSWPLSHPTSSRSRSVELSKRSRTRASVPDSLQLSMSNVNSASEPTRLLAQAARSSVEPSLSARPGAGSSVRALSPTVLRYSICLTRLADLNLPLCAIAFVVVLVFLRLRRPPVESYRAAFFAVDWMYVHMHSLQPKTARD